MFGTKSGKVKDGEVCPGVSYHQHAESLAMFEANQLGVAGPFYDTFVSTWTDENEAELRAGYEAPKELDVDNEELAERIANQAETRTGAVNEIADKL